jgi:hypothetical protein
MVDSLPLRRDFQQHRELSLMTITDDVVGDVSNDKRLVIVMARAHPGEPLSSFVVQGIAGAAR